MKGLERKRTWLSREFLEKTINLILSSDMYQGWVKKEKEMKLILMRRGFHKNHKGRWDRELKECRELYCQKCDAILKTNNKLICTACKKNSKVRKRGLPMGNLLQHF